MTFKISNRLYEISKSAKGFHGMIDTYTIIQSVPVTGNQSCLDIAIIKHKLNRKCINFVQDICDSPKPPHKIGSLIHIPDQGAV